MESNLLTLGASQIIKYAEMYKDTKDPNAWTKILKLDNPIAPTYIQVMDDLGGKGEVAYARWGWDRMDNELQFHKVEVIDESLQKLGVGTTIMNIVIAIAEIYKAPRITGTITGGKYLWHWYAKLGFTIHSQNKLLMELSRS